MPERGRAGGWSQWCQHVLSELERLDEWSRDLQDEVTNLRIEFGKLETAFKIKIGIWGLMGGLIPAAGIFFWWLIKGD